VPNAGRATLRAPISSARASALLVASAIAVAEVRRSGDARSNPEVIVRRVDDRVDVELGDVLLDDADARLRDQPRTRSGVIGSSVTRTPVAANTAFPIAAEIATAPGSPTPLEGFVASPMTSTSIDSGASRNVAIG
jgi:hypothetical protein